MPFQQLEPVIRGKLDLLHYLEEKSENNPEFTWTRVCTGLFYEWTLTTGHSRLDKHGKTGTVLDSGNEGFHASSHHFVGKAVATILANPDLTKNQFVTAASFTATQNELIRCAEEVTGEKWTVSRVRSEDVRKAALRRLAESGPTKAYEAYGNLLGVFIFDDGAGAHAKPRETDNEALRLHSFEEDPREIMEAWIAGQID